MTRVAITGAAAVSPAGFEWRGIADAKVAPAASRRLSRSHPSTSALEVPALSVDALPQPRKHHKLMSWPAKLAAAAVHRCLADVDVGDRAQLGMYFGVGSSAGDIADLEAIARTCVVDRALSMDRLGRNAGQASNPLSTFHALNNLTLCHAAILEGIGGPNAAIFSRGAGTVGAIAEARGALLAGCCEHALAGGADTALHEVVWAKLLREGLGWDVVPAEGAAVVALSRSGQPLAWLDACEVIDTNDVMAALAELAREPADLVVFGASAACSLADRVARAWPSAARIDVVHALGEALAATPALALVTALDAMLSRRLDAAVVVTVDVDGRLGVMRLSRPRSRVVPNSFPDRGRERLRVVITGVGVVSAFGVGKQALFDGLEAGRSAVGPIQSFDASSAPVRVAAEVPVKRIDAAWLASHLGDDVDGALLERWAHDGKLRDRKTGFALLAAAEAWRDAGCDEAAREAPLCLALGLEQPFPEDYARIFDGNRLDLASCEGLPPECLRSSVDLAARCVHRLLELRGPWWVNTSACAAGAMAVMQAASLVERGEADIVVCGGADSMVNPLCMGAFVSLGAPSPRNAADACRPFDATRDGLVIGEGAAMFVIESEDRARARGARVMARVLGWGSSQDAYRVSAPRPDGEAAARAMRAALEKARLRGEQIDWVNAHGTGTPLNDPVECRAIRAAIGAHPVVSSIKGAVGHLMAASGAIEIASCLLAFERGVIPGTAHLRQRDPACDLDILGPEPCRREIATVASNSFGFGGQNASLILGRP